VCRIGEPDRRIYPQRELARLFEERGSGEIGRRTGFRFQRSKGRVGSSPTFRTKEKRPAICGSFLLSAISELLEQTGSCQSKLGVNDSFATTPTNRTVRS
jgi:hypothetical protein